MTALESMPPLSEHIRELEQQASTLTEKQQRLDQLEKEADLLRSEICSGLDAKDKLNAIAEYMRILSRPYSKEPNYAPPEGLQETPVQPEPERVEENTTEESAIPQVTPAIQDPPAPEAQDTLTPQVEDAGIPKPEGLEVLTYGQIAHHILACRPDHWWTTSEVREVMRKWKCEPANMSSTLTSLVKSGLAVREDVDYVAHYTLAPQQTDPEPEAVPAAPQPEEQAPAALTPEQIAAMVEAVLREHPEEDLTKKQLWDFGVKTFPTLKEFEVVQALMTLSAQGTIKTISLGSEDRYSIKQLKLQDVPEPEVEFSQLEIEVWHVFAGRPHQKQTLASLQGIISKKMPNVQREEVREAVEGLVRYDVLASSAGALTSYAVGPKAHRMKGL